MNQLDNESDVVDVVLESSASDFERKVKATNILVTKLGIGFFDANALVYSTPSVVASNISIADANDLKRSLESVGAIVTIKLKGGCESTQSTPVHTSDINKKYSVLIEKIGDNVSETAKFLLYIGCTNEEVSEMLNPYNLPSTIIKSVDIEDAQFIKNVLEKFGTIIEIKENGSKITAQNQKTIVEKVDVILKSEGKDPVATAMALMDEGLSSKTVVELTSQMPSVIFSNVDISFAKEIQKKLENVGASVRLKKKYDTNQKQPVRFSKDSLDKLINLYARQFVEIYVKLNSLENAVEKLPAVVKHQYRNTATFFVEDMLEDRLRVTGVSVDMFLQMSSFDGINQVYAELCGIYEAYMLKKKGGEAYRQLRKDSRGRIIGGGFGLTGAVEGMIMAGAINTATGMAHSIYNGISGAVASVSDRMDMDKDFYDYKDRVRAAVEQDMEGMYNTYLRIAYSKGLK